MALPVSTRLSPFFRAYHLSICRTRSPAYIAEESAAIFFGMSTYQSLKSHVQINGGSEGDRLGMDADAGGLGVGNPDHIGVFDIFMVQYIQDGDSHFEMVAFYAMPVYKGHIQPAV